MHNNLLHGVLRTPLLFFDTTPVGRLLSRFSKDIDVVDTSLPREISDTIYCLFEVIGFSFNLKIKRNFFNKTKNEVEHNSLNDDRLGFKINEKILDNNFFIFFFQNLFLQV